MISSRNRKLLLKIAAGAGLGVIGYSITSSYLDRHASANEDPFPGRNRPFEKVPTRKEQLNRLQNNSFDVLVIGGGATGSGVALDSTTRGLKTALVEKDDFSSGTSSRSTKLIHGGVRYLEKAVKNFDFGQLSLVFDALHERSNLMNNAPNLTKPLPIMTPCYQWWEPPYYWFGLKVYDLLAGKHRMYTTRWVDKKESLRQFPMLSPTKLKGTVVYYDGQMDDARMNVSIALTAAYHGAAIANHVEVVDLCRDENNKINGAKVRDLLTGKEWDIHAKTVINCTGPFSDSIRKLSDPNTQDIICPSAGVHVVLPDYYSPKGTGLIVPKTKDGRVVFMLPWQGETIAGTTDSSTKITFLPQPHEDEINFILDAISDYLRVQVRREDVLAAWSGIRPLAKDTKSSDTAAISRDHVIEVDKNNLVSIAGGKWTTYRKMAEEAVDTAITVGKLNNAGKCATKNMKFLGAEHWDLAFFTVLTQNYRIGQTGQYSSPFPSHIAEHLSYSYGTRSTKVADLAQSGYDTALAEGYPYLEAEVVFAAQEEYAETVLDVLARRTRLAFIDSDAALKAVPRVVELMAGIHGWDKARKKKETEQAQSFLHLMKVGRQK